MQHVELVNAWKGDGGHYGMSFLITLGPTLAAGTDVFCLWWNGPNIKNPNLRFRLRSIKPRIVVTTAFSAAAAADLGLYIARAMTGSDTGGTQKLPAAGQQMYWGAMKSSQVADIRYGSLTPGARSLDAMPVKTWGGWGGVVGLVLPTDESILQPYRTKPIILGGGPPIPPNQTGAGANAAQEGLILQNLTAIPATGVENVYLDIEWDEVNALACLEELEAA